MTGHTPPKKMDKFDFERFTPDELEKRMRVAIHIGMGPAQFQAYKRKYNREGPGPLREAASQMVSDDADQREQYVDAIANAFIAEMSEEGE